ncbi:MAG: glycosyltransferase [Bacteroidaceae bacterium]|nr:glycosyltransferase [Bacteroidaceae bacterium]
MTADISTHKLFTIIIPTWNRCDFLKKNLESMLPFVEPFKDRVRVFVSDNASDDDTSKVVEALKNKYEDILLYQRQPENIGGTANFLDAVQKTNSTYVQLMGDDDIITECFIPVALRLIDKYPDANLYNFNVAGACIMDGAFDKIRDPYFDLNIEKYYTDFTDFVKQHSAIPSLMSSNIFKRQAFVEAALDDNPNDYPGYFWFNKLYKSCVGSHAVYYSLPLIVQNVPNEQRWSKDYPWYSLYCVGRIFKELDASCPGVYAQRQLFLYKNAKSREVVLDVISHNRDLYKKRYEKMAQYVESAKYRQLLKMYIFYPTWLAKLRVLGRKMTEYIGYMMKKC